MRRIKIILFLLIAIGGFAFLALNVNRTVLIYLSQGWPNVTGEIFLSEIKSDTARRQSKYGNRPFQIENSEISYRYIVERKQYVGTTITFIDTSSPDETAAKYPAGKVVQVLYNPNNPEKALLEISNIWDMSWLLALSAAMAAIGLIGLLMSQRSR